MTGHARRAAQGALKRAAAGFDRLRPPARGVVVLIYHRVGRRSTLEVDLPRDVFAAQMAELAGTGRVTSLDAALGRLGDAVPPPGGDPIVVTFDDGTADFADVALPIMVEHGVPATLYLATDFIERQQPFPASGTPLSWNALRDARSTGLVSIGSHTHTHVLLDRVDPGVATVELDRSVAIIAERLGVVAADCSYPKALRPPAPIESLVRARFRSAAIAGTRPNRYGATDPYRLARSPVQTSDAMRWFERKVAGGMRIEDDVRRLVNRVRYAGSHS